MKLIGVLDAGTTALRFVVFEAGRDQIFFFHQIPLTLLRPQDGWCELDPMEIYQASLDCMQVIAARAQRSGVAVKDILAVAVTNQCGTVVVWDRETGKPMYNAIVWMDNRAETTMELLIESMPDEVENKVDFLRSKCGLPLSSYFAGPKLRWLKDNVPAIRIGMEKGTAMFGTIDTWLIYKLTGGRHVTDVTNASRTMLMNIEKLKWDESLLEFFQLPKRLMPKILSSAEHFGNIFGGHLKDVPIMACVGNQQAALIGQGCFKAGQSNASFGAVCSLICNTGNAIVESKNGLETMICYKVGPEAEAVYGIGGSICPAGETFVWLRDKMDMINNLNEIDMMARGVPDTADVYFVPALSGLFAPYWNQSARGAICGLTEETTNDHIVRALLEAACFQIRDVQEALRIDYKAYDMRKLCIDGGMTECEIFPHLLAKILGTAIERPKIPEITAFGASLLAYKAIDNEFTFEKIPSKPNTAEYIIKVTGKQKLRDADYNKWRTAVEHSINWGALPQDDDNSRYTRFESI